MFMYYDYGELIKEFKVDSIEFSIGEDDIIKVARGNPVLNGYKPINDYYIRL